MSGPVAAALACNTSEEASLAMSARVMNAVVIGTAFASCQPLHLYKGTFNHLNIEHTSGSSPLRASPVVLGQRKTFR